ncbi:hypothetical protein HY212_03955 [Candidatus Pacearchaeota archaeon]|nr:hypothetical protein [Candidatus Pacearchaeota archaeon]
MKMQPNYCPNRLKVYSLKEAKQKKLREGERIIELVASKHYKKKTLG